MKLIFTILFSCVAAFCFAQGTLVPFGGTRPVDTAYAARSLRVDSVLRMVKYATTDTNKVLGIDESGKLVLRTKSGIAPTPTLEEVTTAGNITGNSIVSSNSITAAVLGAPLVQTNVVDVEGVQNGTATFKADLVTGATQVILQAPNTSGTLALTSDIPIITAANGLTKIGNEIRLGGALTSNTTIPRNNFGLQIGAVTEGNIIMTSTTASLAAPNIGQISLGGFGKMFVNDTRATPKGLEYLSDYTTLGDSSLVHKAYVRRMIDTAIAISVPTLQEVTDVGAITNDVVTVGGITSGGTITAQEFFAGTKVEGAQISINGPSTGISSIRGDNLSVADFTLQVPAKSGILAVTSDITDSLSNAWRLGGNTVISAQRFGTNNNFNIEIERNSQLVGRFVQDTFNMYDPTGMNTIALSTGNGNDQSNLSIKGNAALSGWQVALQPTSIFWENDLGESNGIVSNGDDMTVGGELSTTNVDFLAATSIQTGNGGHILQTYPDEDRIKMGDVNNQGGGNYLDIRDADNRIDINTQAINLLGVTVPDFTTGGHRYLMRDNTTGKMLKIAEIPIDDLELTRGSATFNGNGATMAFVVTHSLGSTPAQVFVTLTSGLLTLGADTYWVSDKTSTQFTINFNTPPAPGTGNVTFDWSAFK